jgi:hypothetical protein
VNKLVLIDPIEQKLFLNEFEVAAMPHLGEAVISLVQATAYSGYCLRPA